MSALSPISHAIGFHSKTAAPSTCDASTSDSTHHISEVIDRQTIVEVTGHRRLKVAPCANAVCMITFRRALCFIFLSTMVANAAKPPKVDHQQIEQNTRLQIFLDNANFGPGKIDGRQGEFTRKAVALLKQSKGIADTQPPNSKAPIDVTGLDLSGIEPVFITYTITADDVANVGEMPNSTVGQAKVKRLPYASLAEAIAEKFHCDLNFLKALNQKRTDKIKVGDQLTVPNVQPFELSAVKTIQAGAEAKALVANELGEEQASQTDTPAEKPTPSSEPSISLHVSVKEEMLEVRANEKVVAAFPVTVGSQQTASPIGHWNVQAIAKLPNFRYDLKMLKHGERSSNFKMLPPGPNNPVGVIWIALNKKGIGIHGTSDPDSIGRSASHGCIRLANWDIVKLAEMVKTGVAVTVE